jgi:hypothetical protein
VDSRLCAVRLQSSVKVRSCRPSSWNLFVISAYTPTNCSQDADKDEFYIELNELLNLRTLSMGGQLGQSEHKIGGRFAVYSRRTDNGDCLGHTSSMHHMFLCNTNFRHNKRRLVTWCLLSSNRPWSKLDHMAISYRWRGCIQDCQSHWSTDVDSDYFMVLATSSLQFGGKRRKVTSPIALERISDLAVRATYEQALADRLVKITAISIDERWNDLREAIHSAFWSCGVSKTPLSNLGSRRGPLS